MQDNKDKDDSLEEKNKDNDELNKMLIDEDPDIAELIKELKRIDKKRKTPKQRIKELVFYALGVIISFVVYLSTLGILSSFVDFKSWIGVILYSVSLSVLGIVITLFKPLVIRFFLRHPMILLFIKPIITLIAMVIFNYSNQDYVVFNDIPSILLYFVISSVIIGGFDYYRIKLLG